jgi:glutathione S-transferase
MMDSIPIASFLESTYPSPPLAQTSSHGQEIESRVRAVLAKPTYLSIVPREILILSPRSAAYFRRTREAALGHSLEDLMGAHPEKEDKMYEGIKEDMEQLSQLMMANKEQGPFVLGAEPSLTDFFIAGALQSARTVDEGVWRRSVAFEGFRRVYEGCEGWMERRD